MCYGTAVMAGVAVGTATRRSWQASTIASVLTRRVIPTSDRASPSVMLFFSATAVMIAFAIAKKSFLSMVDSCSKKGAFLCLLATVIVATITCGGFCSSLNFGVLAAPRFSAFPGDERRIHGPAAAATGVYDDADSRRRDDDNRRDAMKNERFLDAFDLEAMREGRAMAEFRREFAVDRPVSKAKAKRGVVRGKIGAEGRSGLGSADAKTAKAVTSIIG